MVYHERVSNTDVHASTRPVTMMFFFQGKQGEGWVGWTSNHLIQENVLKQSFSHPHPILIPIQIPGDKFKILYSQALLATYTATNDELNHEG